MEKKDLEYILNLGVDTENQSWNNLISSLAGLASRKNNDHLVLHGAPGTGKTTLAHRNYKCKNELRLVKGPPVEFNCAIMEDIENLEALFNDGGILAQAANGMLILENPACLSSVLQKRLLDVVKTGKYRPLNSKKEVKCNIIFVSTADSSLDATHHNSEFLSRIGMNFYIPSVIERKEDIPAILDYFLTEYNKKTEQNYQFLEEAKNEYLFFAQSSDAIWKFNLVDINYSVQRMVSMSSNSNIDSSVVHKEIENLFKTWYKDKEAAKHTENYRKKLKIRSGKIIGQFKNKLGVNGEKELEDSLNKEFIDIKDIIKILRNKIPEEVNDDLNKLDKFEQIQLLTVYFDCLSSNYMSNAGYKLFYKDQNSVNYNYSDRLKKYFKSLERFKIYISWDYIQNIKRTQIAERSKKNDKKEKKVL